MKSLPVRKRKRISTFVDDVQSESTPQDSIYEKSSLEKRRDAAHEEVMTSYNDDSNHLHTTESTDPQKTQTREARLEQNRRAARETRRRKKVMVEELQRSVLYFSRANSNLKAQNEDFEATLAQALAKVSAMEQAGLDQSSKLKVVPTNSFSKTSVTRQTKPCRKKNLSQEDQERRNEAKEAIEMAKAQAQAMSIPFPQVKKIDSTVGVALQAFYESQGFSPEAARAVSCIAPEALMNVTNKSASDVNKGSNLSVPLSSISKVAEEKPDYVNYMPSSPHPVANPFMALVQLLAVGQAAMMSSQLNQALQQYDSNPYILNATLSALSGQYMNQGQRRDNISNNSQQTNTSTGI